MFWACVVSGILAAGWAGVWYSMITASFSDLAGYGIGYGTESFAEFVAITQRHVSRTALPLIAVLLVSQCGWAILLFRSRPQDPDDRYGPSHRK